MHGDLCSRAARAAAAVSLLTVTTAYAQPNLTDKPMTPLEAKREAVRQAYEQVHEMPPGLGDPARVIYGTDDRRDVYELDPNETTIQFLQQAACVVVFASEVSNNGDGTYTLHTAPWTTYGGSAVCPSEPFYQQDTIGFCSGFLVGSDVIATAGHCVSPGDCGSVAFVFGFDQQSPTVGPDTVVSADNVYFCSSVIDWAQSGGEDHSVVQVDRPVVGRTPVPIRRSGIVSDGDPLVMIGHPVTLPKKIDDGGIVQDNNGSTPWFYANLDAYGGNSGSMVANLNTGVVEGILVRGNTDFVSSGGCLVSNQCPDSGCPDWEESSKTISFAASVPELGLLVTPAGSTTHIGVVGGPFTNPTVTYTLSNNTSDPLDYTVRLVAGGTAPILINGGVADVNGTLPALSDTTVDASVDAAAAAALAAGVYSTDIEFVDITNTINATRTHIVEVGQTAIDVAPGTNLETGGPEGGPFTGTAVYTITSTRPTPVNVQVTASDSWISLDGGAGPLNFTLNSTGETHDVTVGISADAETLAPGLYTGFVNFTNTSGGTGSTLRAVLLDVGRFTYPSTDTPIPINDNSSFTSLITVNDAFCVGDVDVDIDITHTYIGDLIVDLTSPEGRTVRLHNRTGGTTNDLVTTYDDSTNPPDGPGALADFNGENANGTWTLFVSDNAGADTGMLNDWTLRIAAGTGTCPPVALDMQVTVPEGITSSIQLEGQSIGTPFDTIIETLPPRGSLSDPQGGAIAAVPYTLANGGSIVDYTPKPNYVGPDGFTYKVNNGLDSNVAVVSITVEPVPCPGDLDGDLDVDLDDLTLLLQDFGCAGGGCSGDIDGDGDTDLDDLTLLLQAFGSAC
jgi:subtilisin-like proprotein convertase family protein